MLSSNDKYALNIINIVEHELSPFKLCVKPFSKEVSPLNNPFLCSYFHLNRHLNMLPGCFKLKDHCLIEITTTTML